jgi:hypothetical protein
MYSQLRFNVILLIKWLWAMEHVSLIAVICIMNLASEWNLSFIFLWRVLLILTLADRCRESIIVSSFSTFASFCLLPETVYLIFKAHSQDCKEWLLVSLCLSARLSVRMEQLGSHWKEFHKILYLRIFPNLFRKFTCHWNLTKLMGTLLKDQNTFLIISHSFFFNKKCFRQKLYRKSKHKNYTENQNTKIIPKIKIQKSYWKSKYKNYTENQNTKIIPKIKIQKLYRKSKYTFHV